MTKVTHVTTVPLSLNFLSGQASFLRRRNICILAVSSPGPQLAEFSEREGVQVDALEMSRSISPLKDLRSVIALSLLLRRIKPQIVHSHTPKGGLLGMIASTLCRTPVRIYHMRGLPFMTAHGTRRRLLRATERISCQLAHQVICVSHSLRSVAIDEKLCPPDKIVVLAGGSGNGVDASRRFNPDRFGAGHRLSVRKEIGIPNDSFVAGFIGRLVGDKGIVELEKAFRSLESSYPNLHLLLIGPFEPRDAVPADVRERLHGNPRIHLISEFIDPSPLYAAMDIVVLPTYREGFPNVPLEAAAMRLPVVATLIPGCIDAVQDGVTGSLVPPRNAEALAEAIARYIDEPDLLRQHGAKGRERVLSEFRQEVIWQALYEEYARLLNNAGLSISAEAKVA